MTERPLTSVSPDLEKEQVRAFEQYRDACNSACAAAIAKLFPRLSDWPAWLVSHIQPQIQRAIGTLHAADQSDERIGELVGKARDGETEIPGSARDVTAFVQSVYDLAHFQWALTLEKADAIRELAGTEAAKNYLRSRDGQEKRLKTTEPERRSRNENIHKRASELKLDSPRLSGNDVARKLAAEFSISPRQIKRVLTDPT